MCQGAAAADASFTVKPITFAANSPSEYAGQTRWLAAKLTATGRASTWCRHYHETEPQAHECGSSLSAMNSTTDQ